MDSSPAASVVIFNPSKLTDVAAVQAQVAERFRAAGRPAPHWLATTEEDPGVGMARAALQMRPDLIVALGGDGTVRSVAGAIRGSGVTFAILPAGTGNLLARNLDIPLDDLEAALDVALGDVHRTLDVGVIDFVDPAGHHQEPFLVIAGAGFDGYMMRHTRADLKARVGWLAYVVGAARALVQQGFRASVRSDDRRVPRQQVRGVMAANCGLLTGGIRLVPEAQPDDQTLETVILSPEGIVGWFNAFLAVATRRRIGHQVVTVLPCRRLRATFGRPQILQLDGDALGSTRAFEVRLEPACLPTRAPASPADAAHAA